MDASDFRLFALDAARPFGERVASALGVPLSPHEARAFADGEHKTRPLVSVRGADVYVLQALYGEGCDSVNDRLVRLLFFLGALRDAGAGRLTVVAPYLCYARKDRRTKARDPVTLRYLAALLEAVGADRVVALDVHNVAAFENAFRCQTEHLEARRLLAGHVASHEADAELAVVSPDAGGVKRARAFAEALAEALGREVALGFMEKQRSGGRVSDHGFLGEVAGRTAVIVDDLIASGTTVARAAEACRAHGAARVWAAATHGVFSGDAARVLRRAGLDGLLVTDSVRSRPAFVDFGGRVCTVAPLIAEALRRLHTDASIVDLMADPQPALP